LIHLLDKVKLTLRDAEPGPTKLRRGIAPRKSNTRPPRPTRRVAAAALAPENKKKRTP
jgi:hypothetical protein